MTFLVEKQKSMVISSAKTPNDYNEYTMEHHIPSKPIKMSRLIEMSTGNRSILLAFEIKLNFTFREYYTISNKKPVWV